MTSPSEIPSSNGSTTQNPDSTTKVSPPNTPKAKSVLQTNGDKVNGHHHIAPTNPGAANGNGVGDMTVRGQDLETGIVEGPGSVGSIEETRQNGMEEHNDEMPSSSGPKRDLYVGNLYFPSLEGVC